MSVPKRIKIGGAYYKGYVCAVGAATGDHTLVINNTSGAAVNGITITPDIYGVGEKMGLKHYSDVAGTGRVLAILAEEVYNVGKGATIMLDFPAAEMLEPSESLKFVYNNSGAVAKNVYLNVEYIGLKKTS